MDIHQNRSLSLVKNEAMYWAKRDNKVQCLLCPRMCLMGENEIGVCRTRQNVRGSLSALTYGYPCAIHIDPVEKKPLYHFLPATKTLSLSTSGCNLRCLNCQNSEISQLDFDKRKYEFVGSESLVEMALNNNCQSVSYTYTDPVVYYEYTLDTALAAREQGLKNIIVSAGYIHKKPLRQLCTTIDGANIDLKCFDDDVYQKLCGIRIKPVLQTLETLMEEGVWLEITNLLVTGFTDDVKMIKKMCRWLVYHGFSDVPIHFNRFFPGYCLSHLHPTDLHIMDKVYHIARDTGMEYVYLGNVHHSESNTCCNSCGAVLLRRKDYCTDKVDLVGGMCGKCGKPVPGVW